MIKNYLLLAIKHLKKQKVFSVINILGLTVGITCCLMIFLFIMNELSYDNFHKNGKNIYRIMRTGKMNGEEVAELYVSNQNKNIHAPIKSLKGFQRIALKAGETKTVTFSLTADNLSIVNEEGKLYLPTGKLVISVGGGQPGVKNKTTSNVLSKTIIVKEQ